jgi:hypothetical protein
MRTRKDQIQARLDSWRRQLPCLVDVYLSWKNCRQTSDMMDESQISPEAESSWEIRVLDFDSECSVS